MNFFIETLKLSTIKINAEFEATKQIWHNASVGTLREKLIKDILKPYLPNCYGVSGGLCYDENENKSKQLDIVLYDSMYSYRLPFDDDFIVFPCESVYGNIEVKTNLNKQTLNEAIDNIASLKKLKRKEATEFDITPHIEITAGGKHLGSKKNDYFGVVFSYHSSSVDSIMETLKQIEIQTKSNLPDLFVLLDKKTMIFKANLNQETKNFTLDLTGDFEGYVPIETGDNTICYFVLYLLVILYNQHLKSINPIKLFFDEFVGDTSNKVQTQKYSIPKIVNNGNNM